MPRRMLVIPSAREGLSQAAWITRGCLVPKCPLAGSLDVFASRDDHAASIWPYILYKAARAVLTRLWKIRGG